MPVIRYTEHGIESVFRRIFFGLYMRVARHVVKEQFEQRVALIEAQPTVYVTQK